MIITLEEHVHAEGGSTFTAQLDIIGANKDVLHVLQLRIVLGNVDPNRPNHGEISLQGYLKVVRGDQEPKQPLRMVDFRRLDNYANVQAEDFGKVPVETVGTREIVERALAAELVLMDHSIAKIFPTEKSYQKEDSHV
jgi:hypothetical protein